jgi:hypothetical protein
MDRELEHGWKLMSRMIDSEKRVRSKGGMQGQRERERERERERDARSTHDQRLAV